MISSLSPSSQPNSSGNQSITLTELWKLPKEKNAELIHGRLLYKSIPSIKHGRAQGRLILMLGGAFDCSMGEPDSPGGWWLATEVDVQLSKDGVRPDIAGWRRERLPELPNPRPILVQPDWICEILSETNPQQDQVTQLAFYHKHKISHYFIVDPEREILTIYRWIKDGYLTVLTATSDQTIQAEPFDAIPFSVKQLFGDH